MEGWKCQNSSERLRLSWPASLPVTPAALSLAPHPEDARVDRMISIIDLQLEITASAQRFTYSGRCCAEVIKPEVYWVHARRLHDGRHEPKAGGAV
jgi:hypothetical protein